MDSGAAVGVDEDEAQCIDVETVNTTVKVGGDGKPSYVQVRKKGILPINQLVEGKEVRLNLPVFIVPGFGISVFPLSFLLKRKMRISMEATNMTVLAPNDGVLMQAKALHYDRDSWLFYTKVRLDGGHVDIIESTNAAAMATWDKAGAFKKERECTMTRRTTLKATGDKEVDDDLETSKPAGVAYTAINSECHFVPVSYALHLSEGEREQFKLGFIDEALDKTLEFTVSDETGQVMAVSTRDPKALLMLYHRRFGHRNMRDVADMLEIKLPPDMPDCLTCKLAKSKRSTLTGAGRDGEALYDPPRVGHTFAWDHAGPFQVPDWDGNLLLSLKICIKSGKVFGRMVKTTGAVLAEWIDFVRRLNAHFGRAVVARLVTDSAPYFQGHDLQHFNRTQGIEHTLLPPHTQELNGVC